MYWPMIDYTRSTTRPYTEDMVKSTRYNKKGYEEKLVIYEDGMRSWTTDPEVVTFYVKVDERWRQVTSHVLRKRATLTLVNDYLFDGIDCGIVGGWTLSSQHDGTPQALKHYLHMDLRESRTAIPQLQKQAGRCASKLLVDYSNFL